MPERDASNERLAGAPHGAAAVRASPWPGAPHGGSVPATEPFRIPTGSVSVHLFDPSRFLAVLIVLFWPLRFFPVVLIPALLLAVLTMLKHWSDIALDINRLLSEFGTLLRLIFSLLVVNLGVCLTLGAVVRAFGGEVRYFRIMLLLGILPRFVIDRSGIAELDRRGRLWAYGGPLLTRVGFFAFGTMLWATYRPVGSGFSDVALLIAQAGFWTFLFAAMPLLPSDGYNWLATYFRQPVLRQKAFFALYAKLTGRPLGPFVRRRDVRVLVLFAISVVLVTAAVTLGLLIFVGLALTARLQGIGAVILLAIVANLLIWIVRLRSSIARGRRRPRDGTLLRTLLAHHAAPAEPKRQPRRSWWPAWAAAGVALIVIGLLPYSYEPAGPFEIVSGSRSVATAAASGEVVEIAAREGDWVHAGQVVAQLGSWNQQHDVDLARAQLERAKAKLAQLQAHQTTGATGAAAASARPAAGGDEITSARDEVERLTRQLARFEDDLERTKVRAPADGRVTTPDVQLKTGSWLNAGDALLQIDDTRIVKAQIEIPQGDIGLVSPGETVRLRPWSERSREIVGRVTDVAPSAGEKADGNVVRSGASIANSEGLSRPGLQGFAKLENQEMRATDEKANQDVVRVGVSTADPEGLLRQGLRGFAQREDQEMRLPEKETDDDVVRVDASIANPEERLLPGMRGYAKLKGQEMRVWSAYLRLFIRFFTVEIWSWIP